MRMLGWNARGMNVVSGNFVFTDAYGNPIATYYTSSSELVSNYNGCPDQYIAYFYSNTDCSNTFNEIGGGIVSGGVHDDLTASTYSGTWSSSSISYPLDIYFTDGATPPVNLLNYHHQSATDPAYIQDIINGTWCNVDACEQITSTPNGGAPSRGLSSGRVGQHGTGGNGNAYPCPKPYTALLMLLQVGNVPQQLSIHQQT